MDSGNFDWAKSGKFPGFVTPDPGYANMVYASDWGTLAFIVKARVQLMRDLGACISPFNSFLLLLGLESLHVRMREHCKNALAVAKVSYPPSIYLCQTGVFQVFHPFSLKVSGKTPLGGLGELSGSP